MMKYNLLLMTLLFFQTFFGQEIVIAENGLNIRERANANSKKIGKLHCGAKVKVIEKTGKVIILQDGKKTIKGEWVKVEFENYPMFITNQKDGYVFSGYLKNEKKLISEFQNKISKIKKFRDYKIYVDTNPYFIKGDFFGDGISDYAVKVNKDDGKIRIIILNNNGENAQLLKAKRYDAEIVIKENRWETIDEFGGLPIFQKVNAGETLWSNYTNDFRDFKDVPASEKTVLNYDAIYLHASESCGGGFIYWKNSAFYWLQQE